MTVTLVGLAAVKGGSRSGPKVVVGCLKPIKIFLCQYIKTTEYSDWQSHVFLYWHRTIFETYWQDRYTIQCWVGWVLSTVLENWLEQRSFPR